MALEGRPGGAGRARVAILCVWRREREGVGRVGKGSEWIDRIERNDVQRNSPQKARRGSQRAPMAMG